MTKEIEGKIRAFYLECPYPVYSWAGKTAETRKELQPAVDWLNKNSLQEAKNLSQKEAVRFSAECSMWGEIGWVEFDGGYSQAFPKVERQRQNLHGLKSVSSVIKA